MPQIVEHPTAWIGYQFDARLPFHRLIQQATGGLFAHSLLAFSGFHAWSTAFYYEVSKNLLEPGDLNALRGPLHIGRLSRWKLKNPDSRHLLFQKMQWTPEEVVRSRDFLDSLVGKIRYSTTQLFINLAQQRTGARLHFLSESSKRWTCSEMVIRAAPPMRIRESFHIPPRRADDYVPSSSYRNGLFESCSNVYAGTPSHPFGEKNTTPADPKLSSD